MTGGRPLEVADIFRQYGPAYRLSSATTMFPRQWLVMRAIERCRTAALGGHVEECDSCGSLRIAFNSCRDRHCPKCQSLERARWLEARTRDLLPVPYFHVVFTVPEQIAAVALQNKKVVYSILFDATAETLHRIAADRCGSSRSSSVAAFWIDSARRSIAAISSFTARSSICPAAPHSRR